MQYLQCQYGENIKFPSNIGQYEQKSKSNSTFGTYLIRLIGSSMFGLLAEHLESMQFVLKQLTEFFVTRSKKNADKVNLGKLK